VVGRGRGRAARAGSRSVGCVSVELTAGPLRAVYEPGAGMVCSSLQHDGAELLGQREGLEGYVERGKTFGIPLLHPWANRLDGLRYAMGGRVVEIDPAVAPVKLEEHGLPIHGLCAASPFWEVLASSTTSLRAALDFGARPELLAGFPFPHRLELDVTLAPDGLTVRTVLTPTAGVSVPVAFGFHPYLAPPDAPRAAWDVRLPVGRRLLNDSRGIPTGLTEPAGALDGPLGERTFDDGFDELGGDRRLVVTIGDRELAVRFGEGFPVAQVFAPADPEVVCFEPMTAPTNALGAGTARLVPPGESFEATFAVQCRLRA
jgi:aldose 1-epimerase